MVMVFRWNNHQCLVTPKCIAAGCPLPDYYNSSSNNNDNEEGEPDNAT